MPQISHNVLKHLNKLAVEIGERPAASPAYHQAGDYIRETFQTANLELDSVQLDFPNWRCDNAALTLNGESMTLEVNPFSPACDVTAPTIAISTLPELEAAQLNGKIALLYGELSKEPIFPMNFTMYQPERDQKINRLLIEKNPAAILTVNHTMNRRMHIVEDEDMPLPSVTVPVAVGRTLLQHAGDTIHLQINTQSQPGHVETIIGRKPGQTNRRIVLCAHYDTKFGTPGAYDNGTGMAAVLTLAQTLPKIIDGVGLEFVAWGDEEYGGHTDAAYTERFGDQFGQIVCAINLDGIGPLVENTTITLMSHSETFESAVRKVTANYPRVVWVDPWPQSNHSTYAMRGVPSLAFSSLHWERAHQPEDTIDWVGADKLEEAVSLVTDIVKYIQHQPTTWTRP